MLLELVIYIRYIWTLVAYQSYRNLGLCWLVSNQRFLSLHEREGMCTSLQFQRTATNVDGFILIYEINSTEMATKIQNLSLLEEIPKALITLWNAFLHKLALDYIPSCNILLFHVWNFSLPPKRDALTRDIFISLQHWAQCWTHKEHSLCLTSNRTFALMIKPCESWVPEIW